MGKIEDLMSLVESDLVKLDKSNLRQANSKVYYKFRNIFKEILRNCTLVNSDKSLTLLPNSYLRLLSNWAEASAKFDFYLEFEGGYEEISTYQIERVKEDLRNILKSLSRDNVEVTKIKLEEYLKLCDNVLISSPNSSVREILVSKIDEVKELIKKIKYQIFKFQYNSTTKDNLKNIDSYISLVLDDIRKILKDKKVSEVLREELQKYLIETDAIINNFEIVIMLIMLSVDKPNITREELDKLIYAKPKKQEKILKTYMSKDLENEKKQVTTDAESFSFNEIVDYYVKRDYDTLIALFVAFAKTEADVSYFIYCLINNKASLSYILEGIFDWSKKSSDCLIISTVKYLRLSLMKHGEEYVEILDNAVVVAKEKIDIQILLYYIQESHREELIDYVLGYYCYNDHIRLTVNEFIISYGLSNNHPKMLQYIESNELIDFKRMFSYGLSDDVIINYLESYFKKEEVSELKKQDVLIDLYQSARNNYFKKFVIDKMLEYDNYNLFIKLFDKNEYAKNEYNMTAILEILAFIPDSKLKDKLINYLYSTSKSIPREITGKTSFTSIDVNDLTIFEAYYVSSKKIWDYQILDLARNFNEYRLNWTSMYSNITKNSEEFEEFMFLFYKADRNTFLSVVDLDSLDSYLLFKIIKEIPESIIDFINLLKIPEIFKLNEKAKEAFAKWYEEELNKEHLTISDKIHLVLGSNSDKYDKLKLFVYIWIRGVINEEILMYKDSFKGFESLIIASINSLENAYLKPAYILNLTTNLDNIPKDYNNVIFMTVEEQEKILNSNEDERIKKLKLHKYYGDLLKLLKKAHDSLFLRIIVEIAKSGIKEYIIYVKSNYPDYLEVMFPYITDGDILSALLDNSEAVDINTALQVALLELKKDK